ncbi:hypothetical protein BRADI_2g53045v3 [Brachypodium distachyon]|uniref:Uncharacterized protein n=1 Tax=Brachypodium distachyon TaxID=15368 RepID=A0A2K2DFP2_BRADI|nr:hypothetical protein BRADI_2g53045v3 [Brachypodium distachyon]
MRELPPDCRTSGVRFQSRKLLQNVLTRPEHALVLRPAAAAGGNYEKSDAGVGGSLKKQAPGCKSNPIQN